MAWRLNENRVVIQFITFARMPSLAYRARKVRGLPSNTAYYQMAVCEALSRDLDIPLEDLIESLPANAGVKTSLFGEGTRQARLGSRMTVEEVE